MRNFKKILIMICVLSLLAVGCVVVALANDGENAENQGSVAELSELITTAEKATTATSRYEAVAAIKSYLDTKVMDTNEEGYAESILRINAVAVEAADIFIDMVPADVEAAGVDIEEAGDMFIYADDLLNMFDIPEGTAGFTAVKNKYDAALLRLSSALIKDLGTDIKNEANPKTAENKIKLNKANKIITYCVPYSYIPELSAIQAEFQLCVEAHNEAVAKNLDALDKKNDVGNYDLPVYYSEDFEGCRLGNDKSVLPSGWSFTSNGSSNIVGIRQEKNGNKYYVHEYVSTGTPGNSFIQRGLTGFNADKGLVFEFDIATFGEVPAQGILIETGSINGQFPKPYLYINGNGDICTNDKSTVLLKGALAKGGWLHIIIALDPVEFEYSLYVEGQHLATYSATLPDGSSYDITKVSLRLSGGGPSTQGQIAYDNFKIYSGSCYRNQDRLANMTNDEKFIYFVEAFTSANNPVADRKNAYDRATSMIRNYCSIDSTTGEYTCYPPVLDNPTLKNAVDAYMSFDIDTLVSDAKLDNLRTYITLIEDLRKVERSVGTVALRKSKLSDISNFIKKNFNMMDLSADIFSSNYDNPSDLNNSNGVADYDEYVIIYNRLVKQADYDESSTVFIKYMEKFEGATSLAATERYYNFAKDLIDNDLIDVTLITVESTPYRENFKDLIRAYEIYVNAQDKVDSVTKINNSKRIVQCMNIISPYRTEEQWEANADLMMEYINIVKDVVLGADVNGDLLYDPSYDGIDEAVRFFNRAYEYFYAKIQAESIEYITYILGLISATDDYVEKIGLVSLIDRYVATHDVDHSNPEIMVLLDNLDTCKSELELRGEDYSKYLLQNSVYFVNYVEKMRTANTYAEQVEYYEKAALLYFSLDTTVPGTVAAIDTFDEYSTKLDIIKESSVRFLEAVAIYRACETVDDKYAALIDCYYNAQFAELSYEGVAEAMAEYKAAYDAHMNYANSVNADIVVTGNAVGSFRVNCGITTIVAIIIKKIFGV